MNFGSDQFFYKLKNGMLSAANEAFYSDVLREIEHDIRPKVSSMIAYPDNDDVIQQILLSVWISLAKFVRVSESLSVAQRNAWLMRIVNNKIADFFRSKYGNIEDTVLDDSQEYSSPPSCDPAFNLEKKENQRAEEQRVDDLLAYVCSLNILPEKIIAFLYSKVIFFLNSEGSLKGSAKYAYDVLNGKRFSEIMPVFQIDLDTALGRSVPQSIYDMIYKKIGQDNMDCWLEIELQTITDSTSYIIKRVRKDERFHAR